MNILDKKYTDFLILREEKLKEQVNILRNLTKKDILKKIKKRKINKPKHISKKNNYLQIYQFILRDYMKKFNEKKKTKINSLLMELFRSYCDQFNQDDYMEGGAVNNLNSNSIRLSGSSTSKSSSIYPKKKSSSMNSRYFDYKSKNLPLFKNKELIDLLVSNNKFTNDNISPYLLMVEDFKNKRIYNFSLGFLNINSQLIYCYKSLNFEKDRMVLLFLSVREKETENDNQQSQNNIYGDIKDIVVNIGFYKLIYISKENNPLKLAYYDESEIESMDEYFKVDVTFKKKIEEKWNRYKVSTEDNEFELKWYFPDNFLDTKNSIFIKHENKEYVENTNIVIDELFASENNKKKYFPKTICVNLYNLHNYNTKHWIVPETSIYEVCGIYTYKEIDLYNRKFYCFENNNHSRFIIVLDPDVDIFYLCNIEETNDKPNSIKKLFIGKECSSIKNLFISFNLFTLSGDYALYVEKLIIEEPDENPDYYKLPSNFKFLLKKCIDYNSKLVNTPSNDYMDFYGDYPELLEEGLFMNNQILNNSESNESSKSSKSSKNSKSKSKGNELTNIEILNQYGYGKGKFELDKILFWNCFNDQTYQPSSFKIGENDKYFIIGRSLVLFPNNKSKNIEDYPLLYYTGDAYNGYDIHDIYNDKYKSFILNFMGKWMQINFNKDFIIEKVFICPKNNNYLEKRFLKGEWYDAIFEGELQGNEETSILEVKYENDYNEIIRPDLLEYYNNQLIGYLNHGNTGKEEIYTNEEFAIESFTNTYSKYITPIIKRDNKKYTYLNQYIEHAFNLNKSNNLEDNQQENLEEKLLTFFRNFNINTDLDILIQKFLSTYIKKVTFEGDQGIDVGGLRDEFFSLLVKDYKKVFFQTLGQIGSQKNNNIKQRNESEMKRILKKKKVRAKSLSLSFKRNGRYSINGKKTSKGKKSAKRKEPHSDEGIFRELYKSCPANNTLLSVSNSRRNNMVLRFGEENCNVILFLGGLMLAKLITCENNSMERRPIILNMNLSHNMLNNLIDINSSIKYEKLFESIFHDDKSEYVNIAKMDDFPIEETFEYLSLDESYLKILGKKEEDLLEEDRLPLYYLKIYDYYSENLKETFMFCRGFNQVFKTDFYGIHLFNGMKKKYIDTNHLNFILTGGIFDYNKLVDIIEKSKAHIIVESLTENDKTLIVGWLCQIIKEEGDKGNIKFIKDLLFFWTGNVNISDDKNYIINIYNTDINNLPSSHTCFYTLDLQNYPSKEHLKEKLDKALEIGLIGFGVA